MTVKKPAPETDESAAEPEPAPVTPRPKETGGPKGLEPTRYGDWERKGIVSDF